MRIAICDDEHNIHGILKKYICESTIADFHYEITDFFTAEQLVNHYRTNCNYNFDIIFLDIEMPKLSGLEVAEIIRTINYDTIIIFVSNFPHYVFDVFKVEALHFLVKPVSLSEFKNVFSRAVNKYKKLHSTISLRWQNERYVIKISSIKYIEGYKRHITVYSQDGTYEAIGKLPDYLKELSPHGFIRTHQGFIVNMDHIKRFDATDVVLFDGTKVMISVRKRAEALQVFDNYLKSKKW